VLPAAQVPFKPVPATKLEAADLWGNAKSGPHGTLARVPAGSVEPLHRHSADLKVLVVAGSLSYAIEGEPDTPALTQGSYLLIPAGTSHASRCAAGADCLFLLVQDAPMDFLPAK